MDAVLELQKQINDLTAEVGRIRSIESAMDSGWRARHILVNGDFILAQRQAPGTLTTYSNLTGRSFSADQWAITNENASVQYQRVDTAAAPETSLTARFYGKFVKITNTGKMAISQCVESSDCMPLRGRTVRFQVRMKYSVAASMTVRLGLIQLQAAGTGDTLPATFISAFGAAGTDPTLGTNLAYITPTLADGGTISGSALTCVLTSGWVRYSATFTVPTDCKNLIPCIWTNGQPAALDELNIAEAGLYDGPEIRDWCPETVPILVARARRFYCKSFDIGTAPAQAAGNAGAVGYRVMVAGVAGSSSVYIPFQNMRSGPTMTFYNPGAANANWRNITAAADSGAVVTVLAASQNGIIIGNTQVAGDAVPQTILVHYSADAGL